MKLNVKLILPACLLLSMLGSCDPGPSSEKNNTRTDSTQTLPKDSADLIPEQNWSTNATIYQVNLRQFAEGGNIAAFEEHLPRLQQLGVKILWLMSIQPMGQSKRGTRVKSYYSVRNHTAIDSSLGSLEQFNALVQKAHSMGFKVIIDWVPSHTSADHIWIQQGLSNYYRTDPSSESLHPPANSEWQLLSQLNYENQDLRTAMTDAMKFWINQCDIDGFHCNKADWVPSDYWKQVRSELNRIKPVFMVAESENPEIHETAFDMTYNDKFYQIMLNVAQRNVPTSAFKSYLDSSRFQPEIYRMHFITNYAENVRNGCINERFGDRQDQFAALAFTLEGMPLLYSGQEAGLDFSLKPGAPKFIDWSKKDLSEFYGKLIALHKNNKALWNGISGGKAESIDTPEKNIFAFIREKDGHKVVGIFNFGDHSKTILFHNISMHKEKSMKIALSNSVFAAEEGEIFVREEIPVGPGQFFILSNEK